MSCFYVANTVYEDTSDTGVGIYSLTEAQAGEVESKLDEIGWVAVNELSFEVDDLDEPDLPFEGRIERVITFYFE